MSQYETLGRTMSYDGALKIACACGHRSSIPSRDALQVFGEDATPYDIRRRLRCSQCREVGKVVVTI